MNATEKTQLVEEVHGILTKYDTQPAEKLIQLGEAFQKIGTALKDLSRDDALKVVHAVAVLEGIHL